MVVTTDTDTDTDTDHVRHRLAHARLLVGGLALAATNVAWGQAVPGVGGGPARPGAAQAPTIQPGIRVSETVSDNILLAPTGQERSGSITEVAPSVRATASTGRAQGAIDYAVHGIYRNAPGQSQTTVRNTLTASGNTLLIGDSFGVQGSATTYYVNVSPFGVLSADPTLSTANTTRVSTATLAPYLVGRIGTFSTYSAQYSLTRTSTSDNASGLLATHDRRIFGSLNSGSSFLRWGWSLSADSQRRTVDQGQSLERRAAVGTAYFVFSPELRAGGSLNYSMVEGISDVQGRSSGVGPGAFVDWSPNRRTTIRASWAKQFYGSTSSLSVAHSQEHWTFGLNYSRSLLSNSSASLLAINPGALFSGGGYSADLNSVYQQLVSQGVISPNSLLTTGLVNDTLVRSQFLTASIGYALPRVGLVLTGFRSIRNSLLQQQLTDSTGQPLSVAFGRIESLGASANARITLTPTTSVSVLATRTENHSLDDGRTTRFSIASASFTTQMNTHASASLTFRRSIQSGDATLLGYDENAIIGSIFLRF